MLLYVGTFALDAVNSITAMTLVLNGLAAPWVVVNLLGFLLARRGRYDPDDLQAFNQGRRGGRYWFTGGWNLRAVVAWAAGSVFGLLAVQTELYTGPLANLAGGVDLSLLGSGAVAERHLRHRPRRLAREESRMIDPLTRWAAYGEKPDYAGLMSFAGLPYTEDPAELAGADVAIVGAPMDELTSDAPGTRFGPRAIRAASCAAGGHLEARVDALRERAAGRRLRRRADPPRRPGALAPGDRGDRRARCSRPARCRSMLGGDHSIAEPDIRALRGRPRAGRPDPLRRPHGHRARGVRRRAVARQPGCTGSSSPATSIRRATCRSACAATGRARRSSPGSARSGITSHFMHDVRDRGIRAIVADTLGTIGGGPVFVLDRRRRARPAFAPGTGTPEPGGMTSADLLWAAREIGAHIELVGADVVEVLPDRIGTLDITALVADRVIRELLTGVAVARTASRWPQLA